MDLGDEPTLAVANMTDGFLAEGGFTSWNPIPNTTYATKPPPMTNPTKFRAQVGFVRNMQRHGKGFFAINEWGAGPDYHLNPSAQPHNISGPEHQAIRQFVTATFMMVNGGTAGIYLTCIQCYGGRNGGLGNFSIWPEYEAPVGHPVGEPVEDATTGMWARQYSNALALVNPSSASVSAKLPPGCWVSLYGDKLDGPDVAVAAAHGLVLQRC
jgi:hypothetical protein